MMHIAFAPSTPLSAQREAVLIALEFLQVLFLAVHDWVPLGRLNDVSAVRREDSTVRLLTVTLIQTLPFAFGLFYSTKLYGEPYPGWLMRWLFISYLILLLGQLRAWWLPYLVRPEPERAKRYRAMFGRTHSFLKERNGMVPNTAQPASYSDVRNVMSLLAAIGLNLPVRWMLMPIQAIFDLR